MKMQIMKRPVSLIIIASILIFFGVLVGVNDAYIGKFSWRSIFCPLVFISLALNLLQLKIRTRKALIFLFTICLLASVPMFFWAWLHADKVSMRFPFEIILNAPQPHDVPTTLQMVVGFGGVLAVCAWSLWVLLRRDVRELFEHKISSQMTPASM